MTPGDCAQIIDGQRLSREGTDRQSRILSLLDPAAAPVDEHGVDHAIVFAARYAELLNYFDETNSAAGDWGAFFQKDVSFRLAVVALEDVDAYKASLQSWFGYLNELANATNISELKSRLGFLFSAVATLAQRLDQTMLALPAEVPLRATLDTLVRAQLAPAFKRLIAYYKAGLALGLVGASAAPIDVLRSPAVPFDAVLGATGPAALSKAWSEDQDWTAYAAAIAADASVYGPPATIFVQINHASTHALFKSVFDQFLKVFTRTIGEAKAALVDSLDNRDTHDPHYALFLAFLQLLEHGRSLGNALTQRHLDFYYRTILGLEEKAVEPGHVHLVVELAKQAASHLFEAGVPFKAGKDDLGKDAFFANDAELVANKAKVVALQTVYRHGAEAVGGGTQDAGRLFASPVANSDDGLGAALTTADGSWHPFFNKLYVDGALSEIRMPQAEIGFAIASHYLLLAEGTRRLTAIFSVTLAGSNVPPGTKMFHDYSDLVRCFVTTEKGWLELSAKLFLLASDRLQLDVFAGGGAPPIVPYSAKAHGHNFQTQLPLVLVTLAQDESKPYGSSQLEGITVNSISLGVSVEGVKSLAVSNDFGPVDLSKPFQPFGASPVEGSSLTLGSKELFQKKLDALAINVEWLVAPSAYPGAQAMPSVALDTLDDGVWNKETSNATTSLDSTEYDFTDVAGTFVEGPDLTPNAFYGTSSRTGFVRLRLSGDLGQQQYQTALIAYLQQKPSNPQASPPAPPAPPTAAALTVDYQASTEIALDSTDPAAFDGRVGRFFHLAPFGTAERHRYLTPERAVPLIPTFELDRGGQTVASTAELYVGLAGLAPPQNVSLLFQVADGTAAPLAAKPKPHVAWSYLRRNQWVAFEDNQVQDATGELLDSGLVVLAVPRDATSDDTLLPGGNVWVRAAVHEAPDAVCRLRLVAAQAMKASFVDRGNSATFSTTPLPAGTITKLATPDAEVKSIVQPFPSFGGRGAEQSAAFYTRVSERLRHKNRAIELWDYERLVLEAFPQIYKVKCLNHTWFEPTEDGTGIYRELAAGHVTLVTIPNLHDQKQLDPLKPYTALGVLQEVETFLTTRACGFVRLHVKNPQFEELRVRFSLRLQPGRDETYFANLLKQAITRFLSPWAFSEDGAPSFSGKVYKSSLVDFVERQPYVDYVTDFQLFQDVPGQASSSDLDEAVGSTAVSMLVSAAASKHEITLIDPAQDTAVAESCGCGP